MKFLKSCKKILFKLCGKARWLILALVLVLIADFLIDGIPIHEHQIAEIESFAMNDNGKMGITSRDTQNCIYARFDLNTWEQEYCGIGYSVHTSGESEILFSPYAIALTDEGEIYAYDYETLSGTLTTRYSIIRITPDYKKSDEVFTIDISKEDQQKGMKVGLPHYHNGKVSFAVSDAYGIGVNIRQGSFRLTALLSL